MTTGIYKQLSSLCFDRSITNLKNVIYFRQEQFHNIVGKEGKGERVFEMADKRELIPYAGQ